MSQPEFQKQIDEFQTLDLTGLQLEASGENTPPERLKELAAMSIELQWLVASNPTTPSYLLQDLSQSSDVITCQNVAANPNTPAEVLWKLGENFPEQVLNNPIFSLLLLENPNLFELIPEPTMLSFLKCEQVPTSFVNLVCQRGLSVPFFLALIENSQTSQEAWQTFATNKLLRKKLAQSSQTPVKILEILAWDNDVEVRSWVAYHSTSYTSMEILEILASDNDVKIRTILVNNDQTPVTILEKLASDNDVEIRKILVNHAQTSFRILEKLASDNDVEIRKMLINKYQIPFRILEKLASDNDVEIRKMLVNNYQTHVYILEKLASDNDVEVRRNLAQNYYTPVYILAILAWDNDVEVRSLVDCNPSFRSVRGRIFQYYSS